MIEHKRENVGYEAKFQQNAHRQVKSFLIKFDDLAQVSEVDQWYDTVEDIGCDPLFIQSNRIIHI